MTKALDHHVEYLAEAVCLALFMVSAAAFATLLQHPASPWMQTSSGALARLPMGIAMGLTAVGLIYSPWGRRSGAHMNPAVTLTFWRLGKIASADAFFYVAAQFLGGAAGIALATWILRGLPGDGSVNYVATLPGPAGIGVAFAAEAAISFGMMLVVLVVSNASRVQRFTGICAGLLVCAYIVIEAPFSGMSMNPARSVGPALMAGRLESLWIYFTAPLAGMLLAAEVYVRRWGLARIRCAKLDHATDAPCLFRCRMRETADSPSIPSSLDALKAEHPVRLSQGSQSAFKTSRPAAGVPATRLVRGGVEERGTTKTVTSEAEPHAHARRPEAEPREVSA